MIRTKKQLHEYLACDKKALGRTGNRPKFYDIIWKFEILLRKYEFYHNKHSILRIPYGYFFRKISIKCGFSIPINVCEKGLALVHYGTIVISDGAHIGENCRIHEGVCIGATNGEPNSAVIGKNVFIGSGAKIIGKVKIADNVAIAAGAVVVKNIEEKGTTYGGVPARKLSNNDSSANMILIL